MTNAYENLRERSAKVFDLASTVSLLEWDQQTYMPRKGAQGRAHQIATLSRMAHELFTSEEFGAALETAESEVAQLDPDSDEARAVWRLRRDHDKSSKVPPDWVEEHERAVRLAFSTWIEARPASDFKAFLPHLEKILELKHAYLEFFEPYDHPYDPLIDNYAPGTRTEDVKAIFDELRSEQVPLVEAISGRAEAVEDSFLHQPFDDQKQWDFGLEVIKQLGYDFDRGRQDEAPHPFSTSFNTGDVRITNRINSDFFGPTLFGSMHEAGHAMYDQGTPAALDRIPTLSGAAIDSSHHAGLGIHESQSRMMENLIGRSRPFWKAYYARLQEVFPSQLGEVEVEAFYRAINKVRPSLIRVEADEATYNLHIMLRFEIEVGLIERELSAADLPEVWSAKFQEYFGMTPPNEADGVLQDIHWADGYFGYFPTYTFGNLVASQLWRQMASDIPDVDSQIAEGRFEDVVAWLREQVHQHGGKYPAEELLRRITGEGLTARPYLDYLKAKYGEIYGLS